MSNPKITIKKDAPYKIEGDFMINDNGGVQDVINSTIYLCSCGRSEKKPYCDGSHTKCEPPVKNIFTEPTIS